MKHGGCGIYVTMYCHNAGLQIVGQLILQNSSAKLFAMILVSTGFSHSLLSNYIEIMENMQSEIVPELEGQIGG